MSFLGSNFMFGDISSRDFGLMLVAINGSLTDVPSGSDVEIYNASVMGRPDKLLLGVKEERALEFPVEIASETPIDLPTFLRIKQWLFGSPTYRKLRLEDEWYSDYHFNCIFKAGEDIKFGGEYFGVRCTVVCDSPYAYTETIVKEYITNSPPVQENMVFDNLSAEIGGLRPIIEFKTTLQERDHAIENNTTGTALKFAILDPNEVITIDNRNQIITSSTGKNRLPNLSFGDIKINNLTRKSGFLWFAHGVNLLTFHGYFAYIKIKYQIAVRLGGG